MKVLMLSTDQNIFREGSGVRQRMIEYGGLFEELHIIVYTKKSEIRNPKSHAYRQAGETNLKFQIAKNVWAYPTNTHLKPLYFFDAYRIAKQIFRISNFEFRDSVITAQDPFETGLIGYLLKKKFKIPLQLQIHTDFLSPYFWRESLKNKIRVVLAKFLIPKADKIRVVSERIRKSLDLSLRARDSDRGNLIEVRPIPIDTEKIKNSPIKTDLHKKYPNHDFIILMASRLAREKNIGLAIKAMREIAKQYPKTLLVIVGDGPEREALELQVASFKLQDNIAFEPWTDDLSSYYKTADLFLLTSNYEGYGRTAVEAEAAGLPVLMTDVGVAIGETFPIGNLEELIGKLSAKISKR